MISISIWVFSYLDLYFVVLRVAGYSGLES